MAAVIQIDSKGYHQLVVTDNELYDLMDMLEELRRKCYVLRGDWFTVLGDLERIHETGT